MEIRPAVAADAESLSALVLSAKGYWGYEPAQLDAWRASLEVTAESLTTRPTFVGERDGLVVGFYSLIPRRETWELDHLWILPRFMKCGLGRALLAHATRVAAEGGATSIAVDADPNAEAFYLACGARRVGAVAAPIAGRPNRVRPQLVLAIARSMLSASGNAAAANVARPPGSG